MDRTFDTTPSIRASTEPAPKRRRAAPRRVGRRRRRRVAPAARPSPARTPTRRALPHDDGRDTRRSTRCCTRSATSNPCPRRRSRFPSAGTVATVDVAVGDTVGVGQTLATLDTDRARRRRSTESQAALDQAELTLEKALNGESVGGTGNSGDAQTIAFTAPRTRPAMATTTELSAAQHAVLDAQQQVDKDLARRAARARSADADLRAATKPRRPNDGHDDDDDTDDAGRTTSRVPRPRSTRC